MLELREKSLVNVRTQQGMHLYKRLKTCKPDLTTHKINFVSILAN